jgi:LacI family transcriptional regulator
MAIPSTTEIAGATGVSQPTVSRILAGKNHLFADKTVELVLKTAEEMGYRPNLLANGILRGRTHTIGIMVPFRIDGFYSQIVLGAHDRLIESGNAPLLMLSTSRHAEEEQINALLDRRVDGVIYRSMDYVHTEDELTPFVDKDLPCCTINRDVSPQVDAVYTDDVEGARKAAAHLLELGHRDVAFVSWGCAGKDASPLGMRYGVFCEEIEKAGGTVHVAIDPGGEVEGLGERLAAQVLETTPRPTAIFMGMDHMAWGVYRVARRMGLRIPEDLSVVGFADLPFAARLDPPLTTLRQDPYQIGWQAADLLLARVEKKQGKGKQPPPRKVALKPELVVRRSTADVSSGNS